MDSDEDEVSLRPATVRVPQQKVHVNIPNSQQFLKQFHVTQNPLEYGHLDTLSEKEVKTAVKNSPNIIKHFRSVDSFNTVELVFKQLTKWASISYSTYKTKEELKQFFEQMLVITDARIVQKAGGEVAKEEQTCVSFDCLSAVALQLYLDTYVSDSESRLNGLGRMWKIYRSRVHSLQSTLYMIVNSNPKNFVLDSLTANCATKLFSSEPREMKTKWFNISLNMAGNKFVFEEGTSCFILFVEGCVANITAIVTLFVNHERDPDLRGIDWEEPWNSPKPLCEIFDALQSYASTRFDTALKSEFNKALRAYSRFLLQNEIHLLFACFRHEETGRFLVNPLEDFFLWHDYANDCALFGMLLKTLALKFLLTDGASQSRSFHSLSNFIDALKEFGNPISEYTSFFKRVHYDQVWGDHIDSEDAQAFFTKMAFFLRDIEIYSGDKREKSTTSASFSTPSTRQKIYTTPRFKKNSTGVIDVAGQRVKCSVCTQDIVPPKQEPHKCKRCKAICHRACVELCSCGDELEGSERESHGGGGGRVCGPGTRREEEEEEELSDEDQWKDENTEQYKKHFKKDSLCPCKCGNRVLTANHNCMKCKKWVFSPVFCFKDHSFAETKNRGTCNACAKKRRRSTGGRGSSTQID